MLRSSFYTAGVVLLGASAFAQGNLSGQLRPITAPVKYAGVYHVGTGTWTHGTQANAAAAAAGIIYDNTCNTGYYAGTETGQKILDEGRLPSTSSPVLASANGLGNDSEIGSQNSYNVDGFQIAYCSFETALTSYDITFNEAYDACGNSPATSTAAFAVTGLPSSTTLGTQACWIVDLDLCAASLSFPMQGDADGVYVAGTLGDTFGWSYKLTSVTTNPALTNGMIIAGGTLLGGSPTLCSGSDGTVFDTGTVSPVYPANSEAINLGCGTLAAGLTPEDGTGMGTSDRFRSEGAIGLADGCYFFGGNPIGSFHLQLYDSNVQVPTTSAMTAYCDPATAGVLACPCGNPAAGSGRGCNNSAATGGASIAATGAASIAADTLVFTTANQRPSGTTILLQGNASIATGAVFGQGVRCVGGTLKRLYTKSASGGSITAPGVGDASVHARSATLGDTIAPGTHRFYAAYYRDPIVLGGCPAVSTFNITNSGDVLWN
ncbi:MAG: hypothetical protein IPJ19_02610 [Planctomycetes bacterium]|nr:hypothetical protein [Planctomycetota bacterium]